MEETGQNPVILPPQVIEKPTSVMVFGVLNCVFGGLGLLCMPFSMFGILMAERTIEIAPGYKGFLLVSSVIGIGFAAWLLTLGIGLLKLKGWARRGCIVYAWIGIIWSIAGVILNVLAMSRGWMTAPQGQFGLLGGMCGGLIGMIYPVLLLVFMQTPRVKQAFAATGG